MGRNNRNTVNRLPKAERSHPQSKLRLVRSANEPLHPAVVTPRSIGSHEASVQLPNPACAPPPSARSGPVLDDHSLHLVLRYAGLKCVLTALNVCKQWREVATQVLNATNTLELSALYRSGKARDTPPTETQVHALLSKFPHLNALQLKNWPYMDTHPQILRTCAEAHLSPLRVLSLEAIVIDADVMLLAMSTLQHLEEIHLARSKSIDDELLSKMALQTKQSGRMFSKLVVSRAGRVLGTGVSALIAHRFAKVMKVTHCSGLHSIQNPPQEGAGLQDLILSSNVRLSRADLQNLDVQNLNLSQCTSLCNLSIDVVTLENLNLSGCKVLYGFRIGARTTSFSSLRTINVFGARRLHANSLRLLYASQQGCYANLTKLDLSGCSIEDLVLDKYENLQCVNCSGCRSLSRVVIRDCWNLGRVCINGKKLPLSHVEMILPASCIVEGMRDEWNWICCASHKSVFYSTNELTN
eukprot:TRINITY_DN69_c0_g2_i1.p1 TRINITY_DN69_c0_g2~~TRINITY_DN69_c0_g2_i1.p1  ORF type:complete len:469 (+),score=63.45 TRINITY_DN69_c0_g2_i1:96-1502(+)